MQKIIANRVPVVFLLGLILLGGLAALLPRRGGRAVAPVDPNAAAGAPKAIDVVIALDTSSSMDGLINGARQQLWETVAQLGKAQPRPDLRVALISYGNTSYEAESGWVRVDSDLSRDLDGIYGKLFALRTNGGDEYVARAIDDATRRLAWSREPGTKRMLIVAGNEAADQDPKIPVLRAVAAAREQGITVHTIFCGASQHPDSRLWQDVAAAGGGKYASIDHNAVVSVATPVDGTLQQLSEQLNRTYVPYGARGATAAQNQAAQDRNAATLGSAAAAARAVAKSGALYRNSDWDLVDAAREGKLEAIPEAELPAELRKLSPAERGAYLKKQAAERAELQQRIDDLSKDRAQHLKKAKAARPGKAGLDDAMNALF